MTVLRQLTLVLPQPNLDQLGFVGRCIVGQHQLCVELAETLEDWSPNACPNSVNGETHRLARRPGAPGAPDAPSAA